MWAGRTLSGVDRYGKWVTTDLTGWWDSPEPKGEEADRPNADGEYELPVFNEARLISVTGALHTAGHDETHEAMAWLTGAMSGRFQVAGHGPELWCNAVRSTGVKFAPVTDTYAQWQVRLKARDPRKFGEKRFFTANTMENVAIHHKGNYRATPKFTITGSMPGGYTLTVAGRSYIVSRALTTSQPHTVDYRDGRLHVGGSLVATGVMSSQIQLVDPGQRDTLSIAARTTGSGSVTAELIDTYI